MEENNYYGSILLKYLEQEIWNRNLRSIPGNKLQIQNPNSRFLLEKARNARNNRTTRKVFLFRRR